MCDREDIEQPGPQVIWSEAAEQGYQGFILYCEVHDEKKDYMDVHFHNDHK